MNIGVYVAAGANPIFMRMFMLQIERQTRIPEFISVYENGYVTPGFEWACKDILPRLREKTRILYTHDPEKTSEVNWYYRALQPLMHDTETDIFLKMDLDDFYHDTYIRDMEIILDGHDIAINKSSGLLLVRPYKGDFKYKDSTVMFHSPIGAAPTHVAFTRVFAAQYLGMLAGNKDNDKIADDELMAECMKDLNVNLVDGPTNYVYVSHGSNHSSAAWQSTGGRIYFDN